MEKQPSENILYDIDYTGRFIDRISDGVITNLLSVISTASDPAGLVFGTPSISGYVVQVGISGGVDGTTYKITQQIQTDKDAVVEEDFYLAVVDR